MGMFSQRQRYFLQLSRSYPILRHIDIYDRQSFVRAYILDNPYVALLVYFLFYLAVWYATTVIKRIELSNRKMKKVVEENRVKLTDSISLKNKKAEYEDLINKTREAQKETSQKLNHELDALQCDLLSVAEKMAYLMKLVEKYTRARKTLENIGDGTVSRGQASNLLESFKIMEPSFPPPLPEEPPPRKYGTFVTRPPGLRHGSVSPIPAPQKTCPK